MLWGDMNDILCVKNVPHLLKGSVLGEVEEEN